MFPIEEKVLNNIKTNNLISKGDKIIVGLSGGSDSICLLNTLISLKKTLGCKLYAVHLEHKIRGVQAHKDSLFCYDFCKKNNIPFFLKVIDIPKKAGILKSGIEETARKYRYELFFELKAIVKADKIAVAHNLDDQVETFFINLFRGSSLDGLKAMDLKTSNNIIRPLLNIKKSDISEYCTKNNLSFVSDQTNFETKYLRNKIRLELIPYIEKEFSDDIKNIIFKDTKYISLDYNFINDYAKKVFSNYAKITESSAAVPVNAFQTVHKAIRNRMIRQAIEYVKGDLKDISSANIEDAVDLIDNKDNDKMINLPNHFKIYKKNGELIFTFEELEKEPLKYEYELELNKSTKVPQLNMIITLNKLPKEECIKLPTGRDIKAFDFDKVSFPVKIRSRDEGDKIKAIGLGGSKKISDIFIDNKVDKSSRDKYPIFCDSKGIMWLWNYRISEDYKIDENTVNVLRISIRTDKRRD